MSFSVDLLTESDQTVGRGRGEIGKEEIVRVVCDTVANLSGRAGLTEWVECWLGRR